MPARAGPSWRRGAGRRHAGRWGTVRRTTGCPMPAGCGRVLVLDDDADTGEAVKLVLGAEGYAVTFATDGRQALGQLRTGALPHVILLDLMLPGMNGWEFRREQLRDPALAGIPVVLVSGSSDAAEAAAALGCAAWLQKPVDADELLAQVRRHC